MINRRHTKLSDLVSISVLQIGSKSRPSLGHSSGGKKCPGQDQLSLATSFLVGRRGENTHPIFSLEGLVSGKRIAKVSEGSCILYNFRSDFENSHG